jgi:multidrug resistance efflux pump
VRRPGIIALALAGVVLIVTGWVGYRIWTSHRPLQWSGTVEADTIDVGSRVGGRVRDVLAREGDQVEEGQALIVFEPGDLQAQRLQAQGQLEQAQAVLGRLQQGGRTATPRADEIAAARARLDAEQAQVGKTDADRKRSEQLFSSGAATRQELDNARSAAANAISSRNAMKAQLDLLVQGTPEDVKAAIGQVSAAQGRLDQIDVMLSELTVRAPRAARVETLDLRPGDIIAPNATVARLLEQDQLYVRIYVPETQLGYVRPGLEVLISVDTFPRRSFKTVVESVRHEGEYSPRNLQTVDERANQVFATRLRIEEGHDVLRAGMAAMAKVKR